MSMLSITSDMKDKQGLDADKWYEAVVVANDDRMHPDGMMMGRVQARVDEIFDGIEDKDLPWAVPIFIHEDGAHALSGHFAVPKVASKVLLKFQGSNASFPMYRGFHVDVVTQMEEIKYNYPDRVVTRLQNKALIIIDTKDNVAYVRNPGNLKIYIDGNASLEVNGNIDELVHGNVRRTIKGTLDEVVHGDVTREYMKNYDFTVHMNMTRLIKMVFQDIVLGWRNIWTGACKTETTIGFSSEFSTGIRTIQAFGGSSVNIEGSPDIYENSDKGLPLPTIPQFPDEAKKPKFYKWPGVPGSAKGTNTRYRPTKKTCAQQSPEYTKDPTPVNRNVHIPVPEEYPTVSPTSED